MIKKNNWKKYIQFLRRREIEIIIEHIGPTRFKNGLEIGAGNGFQSKLLINFIDNLICTELNENRLLKSHYKTIRYMICDAEKIDTYFKNKKFDFIYSSHLMEHLPNPDKTIKGIYKILDNNGIAIHIIPSSFNAFLRIILWYPSIIISVIKKYILTNSNYTKNNSIIKKDNNLKTARSYNNSKLRKHFIPRPHGVSRNVFSELRAFSKNRWVKEFSKQGFKILEIIKGPVHSGYGFGFYKLRTLLDKVGFAGEYIYIINKDV